MDEKEIIKMLMTDMHMEHQTLAEMCGYKSRTSITNKLNADTMTVESLYRILKALGCELVIRKGDKSYVVSHEGEIKQSKFDFDLSLDRILK